MATAKICIFEYNDIMMSYKYPCLVTCCDLTVGGHPASGNMKIIIGLQKKKMANWDHIISRRISMGRSRSLCLALNAARRRREEKRGEETRGKSIYGKGDHSKI